MAPHEMEQLHDKLKCEALGLFHNTRKMGGTEFSREYAERLEGEIDENYENFVKVNDSKNIFNAARTPAVFFALMTVAYILSGILGFVRLSAFAGIFNVIIGLSLLAIALWSYVRFSGEFREIGSKLDHLAEVIWDEVSHDTCTTFYA